MSVGMDLSTSSLFMEILVSSISISSNEDFKLRITLLNEMSVIKVWLKSKEIILLHLLESEVTCLSLRFFTFLRLSFLTFRVRLVAKKLRESGHRLFDSRLNSANSTHCTG